MTTTHFVSNYLSTEFDATILISMESSFNVDILSYAKYCLTLEIDEIITKTLLASNFLGPKFLIFDHMLH